MFEKRDRISALCIYLDAHPMTVRDRTFTDGTHWEPTYLGAVRSQEHHELTSFHFHSSSLIERRRMPTLSKQLALLEYGTV